MASDALLGLELAFGPIVPGTESLAVKVSESLNIKLSSAPERPDWSASNRNKPMVLRGFPPLPVAAAKSTDAGA